MLASCSSRQDLGECYGDPNAFVALGLLSMGYSTLNPAVKATKSRERRDVLRKLPPSAGLALRFVIAAQAPAVSLPAWSNEQRTSLKASLSEEATRFKDLVLLNVSEDFSRCGMKYLSWFSLAAECFPAAQFFGTGDDDIYLKLDRLYLDLKLSYAELTAEPAATTCNFQWPRDNEEYAPPRPQRTALYALYGTITWNPWVSLDKMDPSTFGGWGVMDWLAASMRQNLQDCREVILRRNLSASELLRLDKQKAIGPPCSLIQSSKGLVDAVFGVADSPPVPIAQGPLFAVSRALGIAVATHAIPEAWLARLASTERLRKYTATHAMPGWVRKKHGACWPTGDSLFGHWVHGVVAAQKLPLTLINLELFKGFHPWVTYSNGQFGNHSIIQHGIKNPNSTLWANTARHGSSGEFVRPRRTCCSCHEMGWSTWPSSVVNRWQCCGVRYPHKALCKGMKQWGGRRIRACTRNTTEYATWELAGTRDRAVRGAPPRKSRQVV